MKTGRPAAPIELSDEEHIELLRRSRQRKGPAESRIRAEIILAYAGGESGTSIPHRPGIGVHMVSRWRVRFSRVPVRRSGPADTRIKKSRTQRWRCMS